MEKKEIQHVSVFPNPVYNEINFVFEKNMAGSNRITIHDASGRLVKEESISNSQLKVADLPPGIYYYEITNDSQIIPGKFTKQ